MLKKECFFFFYLMLISLSSFGQETWGISNSNFAGNMGIFLNPSSIVMAPYKQELNLLAGDIFADNNYLFLKKRSRFIIKSVTGETISSERFGDYYTRAPEKRGYISSYVMGPSYIKNKGKNAWGVHIAIRNAMSATGVPYHLAKFIYEGFDYLPQHGINYSSGPYKSASVGWLEVGGTYARVILKTDHDKHVLKAGITLNFLAGFYGLYLKSDNINYSVPNTNQLIVTNMNAEYGHATPIDGDNFAQDILKIRGFGGSATAGLTYINSMNISAYDCYAQSENKKKYNYRIGFSLIDFGYIKFGSKETRKNVFTNVSTNWQYIDSTRFLNWYHMDTVLSNRFYGNPFSARAGKSFSIFLPSSASLQFDYNFRPKYYINATIIQALPLSDYSVVRSSQVSLTLRYETRKWEIDVPLTYFEYDKLHLGLAIRYGVLVLGTDRLGTLIGAWDASSIDFFFGIKINSCDKLIRKSKTGCPV